MFIYVCGGMSLRLSQRVVVVDFDVVVDLLGLELGGAIDLVGDVLHNLAHIVLLALQLKLHLKHIIHLNNSAYIHT